MTAESMPAPDDYPALGRFFGEAFYDEWELDVGETGDWPEVLDHYLDTHRSESVGPALTELDQLLATNADDTELDRMLEAFRCYYLPDGGRIRQWLLAIRDHLARALS